MSTNNLNFMGQAFLTGTASFVVNGLAHPLSTIQTCMQARSNIPWVTVVSRFRIPFTGLNQQLNSPLRIPLAGLYRGFGAIYMVDAISFGVAYMTNDLFQRSLGPIGAIFAAASISTPFVGIGEGAMQNRQSNNLAYRDMEIWRRSARLPGLFVTMVREVFWNLGIFYVTPMMTRLFRQRWPDSPPWSGQVIAATSTGAMVGLLTTPIACIKTVIQTSREPLSILDAVRRITSPAGSSMRVVRSVHALFAGGTSRIFYLGLSMCMMNLVYQGLPQYLPDRFRRL